MKSNFLIVITLFALGCDDLVIAVSSKQDDAPRDSFSGEETASVRECEYEIAIHPMCTCPIEVTWDLTATVARVGVMSLSVSAEDAQTSICYGGLTGEILTESTFYDADPSVNSLTIEPLTGPAIVFAETLDGVMGATIADASTSNTLAYLHLDDD
jgi:hypothetical protein